MGKVLFTTSWDDGHALDLRVAELLAKHGFKGTFFIPGRVAPGGACNPEGFPVIDTSELRALDSAFELGSHTLDHSYLDAVPPEEARRQVEAGKQWLEDQLGRPVEGFCYPGGHHNAAVRQIVREAGFRYARTTEELHHDVGSDPYRIPVALQFYPRALKGIVKTFIKGAHPWQERRVFGAAITRQELGARLRAVLDRLVEKGGVFHFWGHSWEVEKFGGWTVLDAFLRYAAERVPPEDRVTTMDLAHKPEESADWRPAAAA
ncbi:MAG: polysaccharide deacetylase family protein [Betaproteobacteria bacterium]|nr:polysaccharide deacetylase family protein [Betaproteobacteria bacterium]